MIFQSAKHIYQTVHDSYLGKCNDVYVCEDISDSLKNKYILWAVHDRDVSKVLVGLLQEAGTDSEVFEWFVEEKDLCVILPYEQKRDIFSFYQGNVFTLHECEDICIDLITSIIELKLPMCIRYLILKQRKVNLTREMTVFFSYDIDLSELNSQDGEAQVTMAAALIVRELLEPKKKQKALSYNLLELKIPKEVYKSLPELYKDITLAAVPSTRVKLRRRIKGWFERNKDALFKVVLVIAVVLAAFALIVILSNLVFGDIPIYRLFVNPFKKIGTEMLNKK